MDNVLNCLTELPEFAVLEKAANKHKTCAVFGIDTQKAYFAAMLCSELKKQAFIIVSDENQARIVNEIMQTNLSSSYIYPSKDYNFRDIESISRFDENKRIETLSHIRKKDYKSVIISADSLCSIVIHPDDFKEIIIQNNDSYNFEKLSSDLIGLGYEFFSIVEGPGQFSIRGGIVDIFPPSEELPCRLEFFGDEVDSISSFDINTQRRTELRDYIKITPAKEHTVELTEKLKNALENYKTNQHVIKDLSLLEQGILPHHDRYLPLYYNKFSNILDYADEDTLIFIFDYKAVMERISGFEFRIKEDIETLLDEGFVFLQKDYFFNKAKIIPRIKDPIIFETLPCSINDFPIDEVVNITLYQAVLSSLPIMQEEIKRLIDEEYFVTILVSDKTHMEELRKEFGSDKNLLITIGNIPYGFILPMIKKAIFSYKQKNEIVKPKKQKFERGERIKGFSDIHNGDYIVHVNYGVGIYEGIHKVETQGIIKDFIKIRFAGTDILYIPCSQLDQISKYISGNTDIKIKLNKLGGTDWVKTKQRVKKAVRDLADKLVLLYGERLKLHGYQFSPDNEWQRDFEARFEFDETDDQLRCINEVKHDMEGITPMDRLLCGDVGFGKTEIALRAIFKCVMDSKQAAILAPTTILAFQHYQTMLKRFSDYPVRIELLSRFRTPMQQKEIVKKLRRGELDVVIGTHRLLQKDVEFKNLGLIVVDEEQRFGVAHKEYLKEKTKDADVLTLSATPIPRTLNMSLSGIRDISMLNEAPHNRFPITTYVAEYDIGLVVDAIKREVARGGQCFYLHNRVETIYKTAALLAEKTNVRIQAAHGQMSQEELSEVWESLVNGEVDVLVCTTIIETGVDVSNCNTLIIEDADRLGLAQLHQIRGRVGRTNKRAYAYFMYKKGKVLSTDAYKRLMTIKEFTEFGSGLKIAMRDLEIRGAGDILGAEQSGHLLTVGFDLYMKLLEEAVGEKKGETKKNTECSLEIKINAYIPDNFVKDTETRIEIYKIIASINNIEDYSEVLDELIDRFGEPPKEVISLMQIAKIRAIAASFYINEIMENNDCILIYFEREPSLQLIAQLSSFYPQRGKLLYSVGVKSYFTLKFKDALNELEHFLNNLQKSMDNSTK